MERNRFRVHNCGPSQRPLTTFPSSTAWDVQTNRRSFTARELNDRQMPATSFQRPSSRFNANPSDLVDDDDLSGGQPKTSIHSSDSSESFQLPVGNDRGENVPGSPPSKADSAYKQIAADKLDDLHSTAYGNTEVEDYFGASVQQIEEAIEFLAKSSRYAETLEEGWEGAQGTMQRQHSALLREQEMTAKLTTDLQESRKSLEKMKSAEKDANTRLAKTEEAMRASSSECDRLRGECDRIRSEIKIIGEKFAVERRTSEETQRKHELEVRSMAAKVDNQDELLAQKDQMLHEVNQELAYVQRRIEDEIAARKKINMERDELSRQVVELQDSIKAEQRKLALSEEKNNALVHQLRCAKEEQTEKSRVLIEQLRQESEEQTEKNELAIAQLRRENEAQIEKNSQLMNSFNDCSRKNSILCRDVEVFDQTVRVIESFLVQFSDAIHLCRDRQQDFKLPSLSFVLRGDDSSTVLANVAEKSVGIIRDDIATSGTSQNLRAFSQRLKDALLEAAVREVTLATCFARSRTTLQGLRTAQLEAKQAADRVRKMVQGMKEEISSANKELHGIKDAIGRAGEEWIKWRGQSCESIARVKIEKEVANNELDICRRSLHQFEAANTELREAVSRKESTIKQLQEALTVVGEAKTKAFGELDACRKMLQDSRNEVQTLGKSSKIAIKDAEIMLHSEILAKEQALKDLANYKTELCSAKSELDSRMELANSEREAAKLEFARVMKEKADVSAEVASLKASLDGCIAERDEAAERLVECQNKRQMAEDKLKGLQAETEHNPQVLEATGLSGTADDSQAKKREGNVTDEALRTIKEHSTGSEKVAGNQDKTHAAEGALPKKRQQGKPLPKVAKSKRSKARTPRTTGSRRPKGQPGHGKSILKVGTNENRWSFGEDDDDWFVNCDDDMLEQRKASRPSL